MDLSNLDVERIHTAFSPAREITDPKMFAGRKREIENGIEALMNPGGFISVYGLRGVGKSSIAWQLKLIAEGNTELTNILAISNSLPKRGFDYIVHYVRCDGFVRNVPDLLKRILFGDENNSSLFTLTKAGEKRLLEFKRTVGVEGGAAVFGAKLGAKGIEEKTFEHFISDDLIQQFRQVLGAVRKDNQQKTGLLLLIDEFDTIPDKNGFASIVKACSSEFVKFGVVGIATNLSELIREHGSIGRQIDIISVPLMSSDELDLVLRRSEFRVSNAITFDETARNTIVSKAEGFPYFAHLLGKEAMLSAFRRSSPRITEDDIRIVSEDIAAGRLNTIYEDLYHAAVKSSAQREVLLKAFAEDESDEIFTEPIYSLTKELGLSNPSQLMKELTSPDDGAAVLIKVRDRYYRFSDPVFKVYARLRHWKH